MKTIGIFEAKTKLAAVCDEVAATGQPVQITRRGQPLVTIEPSPEPKERGSSIWEDTEEWWAENADFEAEFPEVWLERSLSSEPISFD